MSDYFDKFQGRFIGIMQWDDCHALLQKLINQPNDWYLYDTLSTAPTETIDTDGFINQIKEIKEIKEVKLRKLFFCDFLVFFELLMNKLFCNVVLFAAALRSS